MPSLAGYAELHCRSSFSFLTGASSPEALVDRAQALGYEALALTDECSLSGVVHAHERAVECGMKLVIGAEMRLEGPGGTPMRLVLLATTRRGYGLLSRWITVARRRAPKGRYEARMADLEGGLPRLPQLAGLPECLALLVPTPGPARLAAMLAPPASPRPASAAAAPEDEALAARRRRLAWLERPADGDGADAEADAEADALADEMADEMADLDGEANAEADAEAGDDPAADARRGHGDRSLALARRVLAGLGAGRGAAPRGAAGTTAANDAPRAAAASLARSPVADEPAAEPSPGAPHPRARATPAGAPIAPREAPSEEALLAQARWLREWFGDRAWLAMPLLMHDDDAELRQRVRRVAEVSGLPIVATGDVLMATRAAKPLQDVLTACRLQRTVADAGAGLEPNAEAHLRARTRLRTIHEPAWMAESVAIAARCAFSLAELRYEYPQEIVPPGHTPTSWLRELTAQGVRRRFPGGVPPKVHAQIEHELALIAQLAYEPYFLTVADIVRWSRDHGILCQGRGSAANSAVCYCLGVTEVDPATTDLLFERFISAERNEPPDIDVDFEHQRREEVIQYLYRKYGRHRAALTGVVIRYRLRSAVRDVGRALGFEPDRIDAVTRALHGVGGTAAGTRAERLVMSMVENGFDVKASPTCRLWVELSMQLVDYPRHLSQHPGGFVIARDDVATLVPVENATMEDRTVIQWDKDDLDALGLLKVDVLALGMLSAIRRSLELVGAKQVALSVPPPAGPGPHPLVVDAAGIDDARFRLQDIPREDARIYEMLKRADSIGVFQVESRAQMSMLPRLKPEKFYDLVIEVAIVRPGPIQGGMVHPYLRRREGSEAVTYPSEETRQALGRTMGVPIFQEQVMQLAILAADFTPGEADKLRRAMAAWKRKGGLGPFYDRLVGRMVEKGYTKDYAESIFRQIEGFGEYGFPESHAASFALLVYASSWIKRHHPDAFLAGLLNSQPMGFYAPAQLVRDARAHGVVVRPVDVVTSDWDSTLEHLDDADLAEDRAGAIAQLPDSPPRGSMCAVRLGLGRIAGLAEEAGLRIVAARAQAPFLDVEDLARRAALDALALQSLAEANALVSLAGARREAAWAVAGVDTRATPLLEQTRTHETGAPELAPMEVGDAVVADYRALGLSLEAHPLALLRPQLARLRIQTAAALNDHGRPGQLARASGLVTHRQQPETAQGVVFVTLEDETGQVNVIVWPAVAAAQRRPLLSASLMTVYGVWQREGEVRHLIARTLVDHTDLLQGLVARSRDFH
jgi:error-prone DNA polymerase